MQKQVVFKRLAALYFFVSYASLCLAQGNGTSGIMQATSMVSSYFDPLTKLIYAVGAVVGLIGGIKVYQKFSFGRSGYVKDSGFVVRSLHLPRYRGNRPALLFPVKL